MNPPSNLLQRLQSEIKGEVLSDPVSLGLYATDASMYQITPLLVVIPRDRADAVRAVRICGELGVPILPRGSGTSLSGQTIAQAVVIDFSKHMNRLLEVNATERWARVEPGLVRDELNALLRPQALHFAPDPATSNRANVGGMISNNSGGMRSVKYGTTIDHVIELDIALSNGEVLNLKPLDGPELEKKCALQTQEGAIYRGVRRIVDEHRGEIAARYSKARRRSSGYMLDHMAMPGAFNLSKLISASEGTLGVILEARVKLEPNPKASGLCVSHFSTITETLSSVTPLVSHAPSSVELLDSIIINLARESLLGRELCYFVEGNPAAILITEFEADTPEQIEAQMQALVTDMEARGLGYRHKVMLDPKGKADVWNMRHNGLGLMTTIKGERKPVPFIEDAAVPLDQLPSYIEAVLRVCKAHGRVVSIFAHAGVGLIHVRPMLDLHNPSEREVMREIADEVFDLVMSHKGALSGEHGDGIVRGGFNERYFGPRLYAAFREIKTLFDPQWLMNPGKIVDAPAMTSNLRFGGEYKMLFTQPEFNYRAEGGMRQAVEQCTGVGACRKTLGGVMCPSYIATRDEEHSTRGRANALRLAMTGQLGAAPFANPRVREVFDLCLSCKACKNECPNSVDMAKLKSEFMHAYYTANGVPLREKMFAHAAASARRGSGARAPLVNALLGLSPVRWAMDRFLKIEARRPLPKYAKQRLSTWLERRAASTSNGHSHHAPTPMQPRPRVALFNDTYSEHHIPGVGRAAIEVLEALGYDVQLVSPGCCQRPAISKGLLAEAKTEGYETLRKLEELAGPAMPIIAIEPSCASALADDLPDLIGDAELGRRISSRVMLLDNFVALALAEQPGRLRFKPTTGERPIHVHGHCHQKALFGTAGTQALLSAIPNAKIKMIEAGCCGMAGSFGYEKEHYAISRKIAEDRLLPYLAKVPAGESIAACGFSCRHQISDFADKKPRHPIEFLRDALEL